MELQIEDIIENYGKYVYNLALKLTTVPEYAEEIAQETFIKAWLHIKELNKPAAIKKWLRTICINEFRMSLRRQGRENISYVENIEDLEREGKLSVSPRPIPFEEIEASEEIKKLRDGCFLAMTKKLSINQRIAFSLVDMFGLSAAEAAEILEVTPKAVKGLLYRARLNLESFFKGHCSFLDQSNPCQCAAWIEFVNKRDYLQAEMRTAISPLHYQEKNHIHDPEAGQKIMHYYHNLPELHPEPDWYQKVIHLVKDFYQEI